MHRSTVPYALCGLAVAFSLAGCSTLSPDGDLLGLVTPYRIEVVQGNVVTKEQIEAVKPGMTRLQVKDILGSPLLTDIFHADRWDYVFTLRRQGAQAQRRSVVVEFEGDLLKRVTASELPTEIEFVAAISPKTAPPKVPQLELSAEQIKALPVPAKPPAQPASAVGPLRDYPPLEPQ